MCLFAVFGKFVDFSFGCVDGEFEIDDVGFLFVDVVLMVGDFAVAFCEAAYKSLNLLSELLISGRHGSWRELGIPTGNQAPLP